MTNFQIFIIIFSPFIVLVYFYSTQGHPIKLVKDIISDYKKLWDERY